MADSDVDECDGAGTKTKFQIIAERAATPDFLMGVIAGAVLPRKFAAGLLVGLIAGVYVQQTYVLPDVEETTKELVKQVHERVPKKS